LSHFTSKNEHNKSELVGGFNPSEKYERQLGIVGVIIPNVWENKFHVPNHQPDNKSRDITFW